MSQMSREEFRDLLQTAIATTIESAQRSVGAPLPSSIMLELGAFGRSGIETSSEDVMTFLYRDGWYPRVIVVGLKGIARGRSLIWLGPSGDDFVSDLSDTPNEPPGMGPFNCVGLMLRPSIWRRPQPFSMKDLRDAAPDWA